eukprot:2681030-Pleurochrysis_carterae.AAC.1
MESAHVCARVRPHAGPVCASARPHVRRFESEFTWRGRAGACVRTRCSRMRVRVRVRTRGRSAGGRVRPL